MSELNIRKAEALAGFYCHPDIIKFIYNVLLHFETPIVLDKLKEVKNEKNSTNTAISIPITSINNLLNDTGTSPIINNTNITNNSTIPAFTFNTGNPPITNNNSTFTTFNTGFNSNNTNNSTIPAFTFNNGISPITTNNLNISNNSAFSPFKTGFSTNNINNINNSNNTINTINTNITNNTINTNKIDLYYTKNLNNTTFEKDALFIFDNKKINTDTELHFKCNVFKDEDVFLFASKYLKNLDNIKTYETQIPNNYTICDENDVVNNYLFNLLNLCSIIIQCNENGEYIINQIHLFLKGFEKLLTQVFIPCYNHSELNKYIHKDIIDSITLPVLFAFGNEFKYHNLSLKTRLINKKVSIQEFEWLKKLVLDKNMLLNFIREEPEKIDCWLHNTSYLIFSYLNFNN